MSSLDKASTNSHCDTFLLRYVAFVWSGRRMRTVDMCHCYGYIGISVSVGVPSMQRHSHSQSPGAGLFGASWSVIISNKYINNSD